MTTPTFCKQCKVRKPNLKTLDAKNYYCSVACQIQHFTFINTKEKRKTSECDTWQKDIDIAISQIICGQFKVGQNWEQVLNNIKCTDIGGRVAKSLVRVAATRIFADPTQSALEPVVNSLDAYFPDKNTGKFGMGFFSLLYWVTDGAKLVIKSTYEKNEQLCAYVATIYMVQNEVYMIHLKNAEHTEHTGTEIHLQMPMSSILISKFKKQLEKLRFTSVAAIYVNDTLLNETGIQDPRVDVMLMENSGFVVTDKAGGITRDVLLGSLVVPTISTKTIQLSEQKKDTQHVANPIVKKKEKSYFEESEFLILVNRIVVVEQRFKLEKHDFVIALDLPSWTKIPVSRDDVILESVEKEFEANLRSIVERLSFEYHTIVPIEIAINRFVEQTASDTNRSIAKKTLQKVLNEKKLLLINYKNYKEFKPLRSLGAFITSLTWDPQLIENYLRLQTNITIDNSHFLNRDVIFYTPFESAKKASQEWLSLLHKSQLWSFKADDSTKICFDIDTLTLWNERTKLFSKGPTNPISKEPWSDSTLKKIDKAQQKRITFLGEQISKPTNGKSLKNAIDILKRIYILHPSKISRYKTEGRAFILSRVYRDGISTIGEYWILLKELDFDITRDIVWGQLNDINDFQLENLFTKKEDLIPCMGKADFRKLVEDNKHNLGKRLQDKFFPSTEKPFSSQTLLTLLGFKFKLEIQFISYKAEESDSNDVVVNNGESIYDAYNRVFQQHPIIKEILRPDKYDIQRIIISYCWWDAYPWCPFEHIKNMKEFKLPWPSKMSYNEDKKEPYFELVLEIRYR